MTDEPRTDLDLQIQQALAIDPSPDFQARVRIRLGDEPQRHGVRIGGLVSGVVALAVSVLLAVFVSSRGAVVLPAGEPVAAPAHTAAVAASMPAPAPEVPVARPRPVAINANASDAVIVPAAERDTFRRFLRAVAENGLTYSILPDTSDDAPLSVPDLTIEPIVIAPIDTSAE